MILIVNLNLAVDHFVEVDELRAGAVQRSLGERRQAGGKGVNVARVLKTLGEPLPLLLGFVGGSTGELIEAGLRAEEIASLSLTRVRAESRTCLVISDRSCREQTVINAPGALVSEEEFRRFEADYRRALELADFVIITGSLPPSLPRDTYARLLEAAHAAGGKRVLLDCAGAALMPALEARPFLVKINGVEAAELLRAPAVTDFAVAARATRKLRETGAESAMITLGAKGAVFDFGDALYRFDAPPVESINSVGSGDAALAGLAAGLSRGWTAQDAGALAIAAGAANALHGAGACSMEEISELLPRVRCE